MIDEELKFYLDRKFEAVDRRFEAVEQRFEAVDRRFEAVDRRLEEVGKKFDDVRAEIEKSETNLLGAFHGWARGMENPSARRIILSRCL